MTAHVRTCQGVPISYLTDTAGRCVTEKLRECVTMLICPVGVCGNARYGWEATCDVRGGGQEGWAKVGKKGVPIAASVDRKCRAIGAASGLPTLVEISHTTLAAALAKYVSDPSAPVATGSGD